MLPASLRASVRAYAQRRGLTMAPALAHLVTVGLQSVEARAKGAGVVNAISPEDRQARARKAAAARWAQPRRKDSGRYAHALDRLCACGHTLGAHTAESTEDEQPCCICDCQKFQPS